MLCYEAESTEAGSEAILIALNLVLQVTFSFSFICVSGFLLITVLSLLIISLLFIDVIITGQPHD